MNTVLLTIILVPIIEIYLFIKIGSQIGAFNTISLIFVTAIIGIVYARYEGLNTMKSGFSQLIKNELPAYEIISGAAIAFASLLLIIPGFATDIFGFLLIFPLTRKLIFGKLSKKFDNKTKGVYVISSEEKREKALKWLKIQDVWGIGYKHAARLKNYNINKAYDFIKLPDDWVRKQMSVVGLRLKKELEGESVLSLEENRSPKKAIVTTRSFEKNLTSFED